MNLALFPGLRSLRASRVFVVLAGLFVLTFGAVVAFILFDQQRVVEATRHLQQQTAPEIIRYQRLARNLEQLRQEGDRVFAATTPQARQQAMFVVMLVSSHPSLLEHPKSAALAREIERFLGDFTQQAVSDSKASGAYRKEWQRFSERLSQLADDVSIQGINLANGDLNEMTGAMLLARYKLMAALGLVGLFLLLFLVLLSRHLILPLQRIDQALSGLSVDQPSPTFAPSVMREIQAIEDAISELHASLLQNEKARIALEDLANNDGLTGLNNRRHFLLLANAEVQRGQRYERPLTVGMADLDFFKNLNDTYGHAAGDSVLRGIASLMRNTFRQSDMICRYGGEEFAFLFPETTLAEALVLAERLRADCANYEIILADGRKLSVSMSIGLSDASHCSLKTALNRADDALYEAKRQGRNRVVLAPATEQQSLKP